MVHCCCPAPVVPKNGKLHSPLRKLSFLSAGIHPGLPGRRRNGIRAGCASRVRARVTGIATTAAGWPRNEVHECTPWPERLADAAEQGKTLYRLETVEAVRGLPPLRWLPQGVSAAGSPGFHYDPNTCAYPSSYLLFHHKFKELHISIKYANDWRVPCLVWLHTGRIRGIARKARC